MPLHHYTCQDCDNDFETLVNRGEEPECPRCESKKLEKHLPLIGMPQIKAGAASSSCGDLSLPPCGAPGCRRTGR
ncbi:MAG: zinc ribbon domain-containing protein [Planctomycetes bacterium]|jgi:putative FmdB family regulatory protein|nr:zinc ribbon domain-containing protein [Planctomycetota bacterium]